MVGLRLGIAGYARKSFLLIGAVLAQPINQVRAAL